jgi:hypothetical protein
VEEVTALLAARAPRLRQAVRGAKKAGYSYVILDGTLNPIDRVARDKPFYSGKHKRHGMNLQVIAGPDGDIRWVSGALPGSVRDKKAEWVWGVLDELEAAGLVTLADKGYQGSEWAKVPYKGKNKPEPQKEANRAHAKLRPPSGRNLRKKYSNHSGDFSSESKIQDTRSSSRKRLAAHHTRGGQFGDFSPVVPKAGEDLFVVLSHEWRGVLVCRNGVVCPSRRPH